MHERNQCLGREARVMGTHCLLPRRGCDFGGKQAYFLTEVILTVSGDLRTDAVLGGGGPSTILCPFSPS